MARDVPTTDGSDRSRPASSRRRIQVIIAAVAIISISGTAILLQGAPRSRPAPNSGSQSLAGRAVPVGATSRPTPLTTTPTTTNEFGTSTDPATDAGPPNDPAAEAKIVAATTAFIGAWLHPGTPAERTAALTPLTTTQLLARVANLPADALPQAQLSSVKVMSFDESTAVAAASLSDGLTALCQLVASAGGRWRVSAVDRSAGPPVSTTSPPNG